MSRALILCLLLCFSGPLLAAPPSRIEASYDVLKGGIRVAVMTETFIRQHDHYTLESVSRAVWPLTMFKAETIWVNSSGTITAQGLRPDAYSSKRKLDEDRNARAGFDWEKRQITLEDRAGRRTLLLPIGTQDRLSAMYQLMFLPLHDMHVLKFYMTNGSKVDDYTFDITHGLSVTVPLGTFSAIYLATPPEKNASRTEIWVAREHANFPYKLVITEPDGGQFTQVLTGIDFTP
jgi:hypothetical protein